MAGIRITLKETGQQSIARLWVHTPPESEKKEEPDYLIHFRRPETYNGEFGFDWMRDDYSTVCNNYEELKKEYYDCEKNEKVELGHKEYFVPWLSMLPKQEDDDELKREVKLKIEVEKLNNYQIQDDDYMEIPSKAGVIFNPNKIKVSEINKNTTIEVICKEPLERDICIIVLDKNNIEVGKLNVFANNEILTLDIKFVKVYWERHLKQLKEINNLRNANGYIDVLKKSLGQALINVNILQSDFDKWDSIKIEDLKREKGEILFDTSNRMTKEGRKRVKEKCPIENYKGIVVFYTSFDKVPENRYAAGDAQIYPLDYKFVFIYQNSARNTDLSHEIGHTLGLEHSFDELKNNQGEILTQNQRIEELELEIKRTRLVHDLKVKKDKLSIMKKNLHKYKEGKTSNIMDYTLYGEFDIKDFSHWQWKVMRDEVKNFYN